MKNLYVAILAACLGAISGLTVQAQNTAYGNGALASNTTGFGSAAFGDSALYSNTTGKVNTATGFGALYSNTTGSDNTAVGASALKNNVGGSNTATGAQALYSNTTGNANAAYGLYSLLYDTTGSYNIGLGYLSGGNITTGFYNIAIGNEGTSTDSGVIRIGTANQQTSFYAAGINGVPISDGVEVYINSSGQLGTVNSSIRFKQDVQDMADASDRLFQLRPVIYRYKQAYADGSRPVEYGLIAEEVAQVYPDLVAHDASGRIQTVQYQKLTPMLLNEVQKQHRQLEAQQQTIETLEQRLSRLENKLEAAMSSSDNTIAMASK